MYVCSWTVPEGPKLSILHSAIFGKLHQLVSFFGETGVLKNPKPASIEFLKPKKKTVVQQVSATVKTLAFVELLTDGRKCATVRNTITRGAQWYVNGGLSHEYPYFQASRP
jgi:hypothetical protein